MLAKLGNIFNFNEILIFIDLVQLNLTALRHLLI